MHAHHILAVLIILSFYSGLPKLQARKFVGCAQQLKVPSYGYMPSLGSATEYETANTDFSSDTTSVCNWSSGGSGSRYIAVRYMPCRDVFIGSIQPKLISGLDPERHTLLHLCDHIKNQERIENGFEVELFSHEGYPLNTNDYTINCKWCYCWNPTCSNGPFHIRMHRNCSEPWHHIQNTLLHHIGSLTAASRILLFLQHNANTNSNIIRKLALWSIKDVVIWWRYTCMNWESQAV